MDNNKDPKDELNEADTPSSSAPTDNETAPNTEPSAETEITRPLPLMRELLLLL